MKKHRSIIHIIETIGIGGGSETLLANTVKNLKTGKNVVVTLYPYHKEYDLGDIPVYCLNITSKVFLLPALIKLRKLIQKHDIDLIHAHLFWAIFLARIAKPKHVRLVISIHSILSVDLFQKKKSSLWLEKLLMNRQDAVIAVSKVALDDYIGFTDFRKKNYVLHNFIPDRFFVNAIKQNASTAKICCVYAGHFKPGKNHILLVHAFEKLPSDKIQLDLYGEGPLEKEVELAIKQHNVSSVRLAGLCNDMNDVLSKYDVFISASEHEGFGIALLEAMAVGLICIVSDIPAHREVGGDACVFFDITSPDFLRDVLQKMIDGKLDLSHLPAKAKQRAWEISNPETYLNKLEKIYEEVLQ
jgi:glycosyltransferase involved in cell wall biosynthesis